MAVILHFYPPTEPPESIHRRIAEIFDCIRDFQAFEFRLFCQLKILHLLWLNETLDTLCRRTPLNSSDSAFNRTVNMIRYALFVCKEWNSQRTRCDEAKLRMVIYWTGNSGWHIEEMLSFRHKRAKSTDWIHQYVPCTACQFVFEIAVFQ